MQIINFCLVITALIIAIIALTRSEKDGYDTSNSSCCITTPCSDQTSGWCIGDSKSTPGNLGFYNAGKEAVSISPTW